MGRKPDIFVDIMGGDEAPEEQAKGVLEAHKVLGPACALTAVGQARYAKLFDGTEVSFIPIAGVVGMNDDPLRATEKEPTTSVGLAVKLAAGHSNAAAVSCGNTGAAVAAGRRHMRALVNAPYCLAAIAALMPNFDGTKTVLMDVGANPSSELNAYDYLDMGWMSAVYARHLNPQVERPVGLLSYGSEPHKAPPVLQEALALFRNHLGSRERFAEGNDLMTGEYGGLVADGMTLNVALKVVEGTLKGASTTILAGLCSVFDDSPEIKGTIVAATKRTMAPFNWRNNNGALLVGLNGNVIIGHGRSDHTAVTNAIMVAEDVARGNLLSKFTRALADARASGCYH